MVERKSHGPWNESDLGLLPSPASTDCVSAGHLYKFSQVNWR